MEWVIAAFWAKIGWVLGELAIFVVVITVSFVILLLLSTRRVIRQNRCRHVHFHETRACEAICNDCGKNLGFIGTWRARAISTD